MAEIATGVLHNIGNVINSVNISANVIEQIQNESSISHLSRVADLLREQEGNLHEFFSNDPRAPAIPKYIRKIYKTLHEENEHLAEEVESLQGHLEHMKRVISAQQETAKAPMLFETVSPIDLLRTSLELAKNAMSSTAVEISESFDGTIEKLKTDKHRVIQILLNLIKNAFEAVEDTENPKIKVDVTSDGESTTFQITDNGIGISATEMRQIFRHGFTTKNNGHGFGLHSCANAATELGGCLKLSSDGKGKGATFTLSLPNTPSP